MSSSCLHSLLLLVLCTILPRAPAAPSFPFGVPNCPCINPWENISALPAGMHNAVDNCVNVPQSRVNISSSQCYNVSYGTSCAAHDRNAKCQETAKQLGAVRVPQRCEADWCYVDPGNCNGTAYRQEVASNSSLFDSFPLHPSYETCGFLYEYTESPLRGILQGKTLRVSWPTEPSLNMFAFVPAYNAQGPEGSVFRFMQGVARDMGITVKLQNISETSLKTFFWSSYTACIQDVALNRTDLCVGDFWPTAARRVVSEFSPELFQTIFYLIVPIEEEKMKFWKMMLRPFAPFSTGVWCVISAIQVMIAFFIYVIEVGEGGVDEFQEKESVTHGLIRSVYMSWMGLWGSSSPYNAKSVYGRVINFTFGFFLLVIASSYTANLASFLVQTGQASSVSSVEDAVSRGWNICGGVVMKDTLLSIHPTVQPLFVMTYDDVQSLQAMDAGNCSAAVIAESSYVVSQTGAYDKTNPSRFCKYIMVGPPVMTIGNAMPVRKELAPAMGWAVALHLSRGKYPPLEAIAKAEMLPANQCGGDQTVEDSFALNLADMAGTLIITIVIACICFLIYLILERQACLRKCVNWSCCRDQRDDDLIPPFGGKSFNGGTARSSQPVATPAEERLADIVAARVGDDIVEKLAAQLMRLRRPTVAQPPLKTPPPPSEESSREISREREALGAIGLTVSRVPRPNGVKTPPPTNIYNTNNNNDNNTNNNNNNSNNRITNPLRHETSAEPSIRAPTGLPAHALPVPTSALSSAFNFLSEPIRAPFSQPEAPGFGRQTSRLPESFPFRAVVTHTWQGELQAHLPVQAGQHVWVLSQQFPGWYEVSDENGYEGGVPIAILTPLISPRT